jgi:hypothetical protein
MQEYQRKIKGSKSETVISGMRCDRCGYTQLDSDEDIWSAVGL